MKEYALEGEQSGGEKKRDYQFDREEGRRESKQKFDKKQSLEPLQRGKVENRLG